MPDFYCCCFLNTQLCLVCELRGQSSKCSLFSTKRFLLNYHDKVEKAFDL